MTDCRSSCAPSIRADLPFIELCSAVQACDRCPAMRGQPRILSMANGPVPCAIMLVGEAPGRHGATRTGVPFTGDESGRRLDRLLAAAGWERSAVFLTNAVLCGPLDVRGNNRPPHAIELQNCAGWLRRQIDIVEPELVVGLGAVALRALAGIEPHDLRVSDAGRAPIDWYGRRLAGAFHPGARAAVHRPIAAQLADFVFLGDWYRATNA